jgi:hypothetical protein
MLKVNGDQRYRGDGSDGFYLLLDTRLGAEPAKVCNNKKLNQENRPLGFRPSIYAASD